MGVHFLRMYRGSGLQMVNVGGRDVPIVDTVEEGDVVAIWMAEETPLEVETPDVQARLDERGALWFRCHSVMCPEGECGYVSIDPLDESIVAINEAAFESARERGWRLPDGGLGVEDVLPIELARLRQLARRTHPAWRAGARLEEITFADARVGDYATAEPEEGTSARFVRIEVISKSSRDPTWLALTFSTPEHGERFVIHRPPDEAVWVDATERGPSA